MNILVEKVSSEGQNCFPNCKFQRKILELSDII